MIDLDKILDAQNTWQIALLQNDQKVREIASESLLKCAEAISILLVNLKQIGYEWAYVEKLPGEVVDRNISAIKKVTSSPIPPILIMFWKQIGSVTLVDLEHYRHLDFWKEQQITGSLGFCDGLFLYPCDDEWASFVGDDYQDWQEYKEPEEISYLLTLSPDGYHKDNISGGAPYGVYAEPSWKPTWQNYSWPGYKHPISAPTHPPDFLSYLRTAILECAGFPGFLGLPAFESIKERLLKGVPLF